MKTLLLFLFASPNIAIYSQNIGIIAHGENAGVHGISGGSGFTTSASRNVGVHGSGRDYGIYGESVQPEGTGAFFFGAGGTAIELGGADSEWGNGSDDSVIRTRKGSETGDLILVTNDVLSIHLDDDNNSTSEFAIINGANTQILTLTESGNMTITGTYSPSSDVNRKEKITLIDNRSILDKVTALPISEWQFKGEEIRHIGPMAQDFYAAFGFGQGETTISTVDADGVALAAIQELKKENDILKEQILILHYQVAQLQAIDRK